MDAARAVWSWPTSGPLPQAPTTAAQAGPSTPGLGAWARARLLCSGACRLPLSRSHEGPPRGAPRAGSTQGGRHLCWLFPFHFPPHPPPPFPTLLPGVAS